MFSKGLKNVEWFTCEYGRNRFFGKHYVFAIAIVTGKQRFFVALAVAGIIASFAMSLFTMALSGTIIKVCTFVMIIMFAARTFKMISKKI